MVIYGIALSPLSETLQAEHPEATQAWYADDSAISGKLSAVRGAFTRLCELAPAYGYYPEPEKSTVVVDNDNLQAAEARLGDLGLRFSDVERYIGAFVGSKQARLKWLQPKIDGWVDAVFRLS